MLANDVKPTGNHIVDLVAYKILSEAAPARAAPCRATP